MTFVVPTFIGGKSKLRVHRHMIYICCVRRVRWAWVGLGGVTDERRASLSTISRIARNVENVARHT